MESEVFARYILFGCMTVIVLVSFERICKTPEAHIDLFSFQSVIRLAVYSVAALIVFGFIVSLLLSLRTQIPDLINFIGSDAYGSFAEKHDIIARMIENTHAAQGRAALAPAGVLGAAALLAMPKLPWVGRADLTFRRWLCSIDFRAKEAEQIEILLRGSAFKPTESERQANREKLQKFEFYLENDQLEIDEGVIGLWRKVSGLLRLIDFWQERHKTLLTPDEMDLAAEISAVDERKTRVALAVVRVMLSVQSSDPEQSGESEVQRLGTVRHQDRPGIDALEEDLELRLIEQADPRSNSAVRIELQELARYIKQIEGYFQIEYGILFDKLIGLVAQAVCHHRRSTLMFVDELHGIGFVDMAGYMRFRFEQIFIIALALFAALALGFFTIDLAFDQISAMPMAKIFVIFFVYLAAVICAIGFGCSRAVAEKPVTPWKEFAKASFASLAAFVVIHSTNFAFTQTTEMTLTAYLAHVWFWAWFPFTATLALCWRGSYREELDQEGCAWRMRARDGAWVAAAMVLGGLLVLWGMQYGNPELFAKFVPNGTPDLVMILALEAIAACIGFVLGASIPLDMRRSNSFLAATFGTGNRAAAPA